MTHVEMLKEMAKMQEALDEALLEKGRQLGKIEEFDRDRCTFALIDELGEMVHELKGDWCWWKATQKPVDRQKVLEELVDVWHFTLSLDNNNREFALPNFFILGKLHPSNDMIIITINKTIEDAYSGYNISNRVYALTYLLGFTMEDVYQGYIKKNKENYERIERGY